MRYANVETFWLHNFEGGKLDRHAVYANYSTWAAARNRYPLPRQTFEAILTALGVGHRLV